MDLTLTSAGAGGEGPRARWARAGRERENRKWEDDGEGRDAEETVPARTRATRHKKTKVVWTEVPEARGRVLDCSVRGGIRIPWEQRDGPRDGVG